MKRGRALLIAHCGNAARPARYAALLPPTGQQAPDSPSRHMHEHHRVASVAHTRPPIGSFHLAREPALGVGQARRRSLADIDATTLDCCVARFAAARRRQGSRPPTATSPESAAQVRSPLRRSVVRHEQPRALVVTVDEAHEPAPPAVQRRRGRSPPSSPRRETTRQAAIGHLR
jgi:hypothetical protein